MKDRKLNRTSQINFAPHHLANPIATPKTMTDQPPPFPEVVIDISGEKMHCGQTVQKGCGGRIKVIVEPR